ncbi:replication-relaxation family protein [Dactylosporangium maewongense]|uniref:replication-relaxation family protein n=1 Tax=Dactylosporangium maewongense TaxID=634393 RepID=UPI0031D9D640
MSRRVPGRSEAGASRRAIPDSSKYQLARWWSGATIAAVLDSRVVPDGHGVWREGDHTVAFYLEYDTGTETLSTVAAKLPAYRRVQDLGGPRWPVLFVLPSRLREGNLRQRLAATGTSGVTVATASQDRVDTDPSGPIWALAGDTGPRRRLIDVPCELGSASPLNPGPATPDQDPLRLLRDQD